MYVHDIKLLHYDTSRVKSEGVALVPRIRRMSAASFSSSTLLLGLFLMSSTRLSETRSSVNPWLCRRLLKPFDVKTYLGF